MSHVLALITQDAALLPCELDRVRPGVAFAADEVLGVGAWHEGQVIQRRYGAGARRESMWDISDSQAVMMATTRLRVEHHTEDSTQPFRFRQWLFAAVAPNDFQPELRERLREELPEFLAAAVQGPTWEEVLFARFLAELRTHGQLDAAQVDVGQLAAYMSVCADAVDQVAQRLGAPRRPTFDMVASNGSALAAARRGDVPLFYTLLEGQAQCERHHLTAASSEGDTLVRDHRRRRTVVVSSAVREGASGWVLLPDRSTLAVDRRITVVIR